MTGLRLFIISHPKGDYVERLSRVVVMSMKQIVWSFGQDRNDRVKLVVARPVFIWSVIWLVVLLLVFEFGQDKY